MAEEFKELNRNESKTALFDLISYLYSNINYVLQLIVQVRQSLQRRKSKHTASKCGF